MSLYVQWLNLIKERSTEAWLTDAQRVVYNKLLSQWSSAPFVNVWGPPGCGKSFLARILTKENGYTYAVNLQAVPEGTANVALDDATYTRLMRPLARQMGLGRIILLTPKPVSDPMPRAEIHLGEHDVRQFLHNLHYYCGLTFVHSEPCGTDLAQIIRSEAIAIGGSNAA